MGILPDNFVCPDCGFSFRLNPIQIWKVQRAKAPCPKCGSTTASEKLREAMGGEDWDEMMKWRRTIRKYLPWAVLLGLLAVLLNFLF